MRYCVEYLTGRPIRGMDITKKNVNKALLNLQANLEKLGYKSQIVEKETRELAKEWQKGKKMILVMFPRKYPERRDPIFVVPIHIKPLGDDYKIDCYTAKAEITLAGDVAEYYPSYVFSSQDKIKGVIILGKNK